MQRTVPVFAIFVGGNLQTLAIREQVAIGREMRRRRLYRFERKRCRRELLFALRRRFVSRKKPEDCLVRTKIAHRFFDACKEGRFPLFKQRVVIRPLVVEDDAQPLFFTRIKRAQHVRLFAVVRVIHKRHGKIEAELFPKRNILLVPRPAGGIIPKSDLIQTLHDLSRQSGNAER